MSVNQTTYKKGASVEVPDVSGDLAIICDTDGTLKTLASDGTKSSIGGGGGGGVTSVTAAGYLTASAATGAVTLTGPDLGTRQTLGANGQSITVGSLPGSTAGGFEIDGFVESTTGADDDFILQINGVTTGYVSAVMNYANAGVTTSETGDLGGGTTTTGIAVARGGAAGREQVHFSFTVSNTDGTRLLIEGVAQTVNKTTGALAISYHTQSTFVPAAAITSVTFTTKSGGATELKSGGYMRVRARGFTA